MTGHQTNTDAGQQARPFRYLDPGIVALLERLAVDLVLDVGANKGQFAKELMRAGYRHRILSFEPLEDAYSALSRASTQFPYWSVAPRCAIGAKQATVELNVAGNSQSSSVLNMLASHSDVAPASAYVGTETVPLCRLDEVAADAISKARSPFLKIDVQGLEDQVLEGAASIIDSLVGMQLELDLEPLYESALLIEDMLPRIRALGFSTYKLIPGFVDRRTGRLLQVDGLFFRESALSADTPSNQGVLE